MMLTLQFDGLFRSAPEDLKLGCSAGFMCYGWVILRDGALVGHGHGGYARCENASSIVAEYLGLIEGLEALLDMHAESELVMICGDAKSIIDQMTGASVVSADSIKPLYRRARKLTGRFSQIYWNWTPRRLNHTADALTRRALQQIRSRPEQWQAAIDYFTSIKSRRQTASRLLPILDLRMYVN